MFRKLLDRLLNAKSQQEIVNVLYAADGVDLMYQAEKLSWEDHERLFNLADRLLTNH